ncbi:MAG: helix-turn-helix transcriptional regulator [Spirochaetales bacterium]|nr:helix-turn-helix transcriptional regulator [Spirochaetales bacterium]
MNLEQIVIENIKRIRKEKHITQERLAEYCETSVSYIGLMETYKNIPKLSTIERIAEALNVPVLDLFRENELTKDIASPQKSGLELDKEKARKQKIREHLKEELLSRLGSDLDDLLQMI